MDLSLARITFDYCKLNFLDKRKSFSH